MGALYSETVRLSAGLAVLLGGSVVLTLALLWRVPGAPWWAAVPLVAILVLVVAGFGKLVIEVEADELVARFGAFGWPSQRVRHSEILSARAVSYRPIRQFGGWGLRCGSFDGERTSVYSVRGERGVLLELSTPRRIAGFETRRFLVGTQEPERLLEWLPTDARTADEVES